MNRFANFMKAHWSWLSAVIALILGSVLWLHSQHIMLQRVETSVMNIPSQVYRMVNCHRHDPLTGEVTFLPCAILDKPHHTSSVGDTIDMPRYLANSKMDGSQ